MNHSRWLHSSTLNDLKVCGGCVGFRGLYWQKWNTFTIIFLEVYNHLKLNIFVLLLPQNEVTITLYLQSELVLFHGAHHLAAPCFYSISEWTNTCSREGCIYGPL